jgi:hypothetical protein
MGGAPSKTITGRIFMCSNLQSLNLNKKTIMFIIFKDTIDVSAEESEDVCEYRYRYDLI